MRMPPSINNRHILEKEKKKNTLNYAMLST
jgi:hypothetical protein